MAFLTGKVQYVDRSAPTCISNKLPDGVIERDGKYFDKKSGKELICKKINAKELLMSEKTKDLKLNKMEIGIIYEAVKMFEKKTITLAAHESTANGLGLHSDQFKELNIKTRKMKHEFQSYLVELRDV